MPGLCRIGRSRMERVSPRCEPNRASALMSAASCPRQPLLRQKLNSHRRRTSSSPLNSSSVWTTFARSIVTRSLPAPARRKQWENCIGSGSADRSALLAATCTAPRSNGNCDRSTGIRSSTTLAPAKASASSSAGSAASRRSSSAGRSSADTRRREKTAICSL
jgi:hypothetical protein